MKDLGLWLHRDHLKGGRISAELLWSEGELGSNQGHLSTIVELHHFL